MRNFRFGRVLVATALSLSFVLPAVRAAEPKDLLKHIPDDAWGFVILKSLENTDKKAMILKDKLGLPVQPITPMAMGMLQLQAELDPANPLGVAILDYTKFDKNAFVAIIPTKDAKAVLQKLNAGEPEDGVAECKVMGQTMYAATKDNVVYAGPGQDCVTRVAKSKKGQDAGFSDARAAALAKSDVFVSLCPKAIMTAYKDMATGMLTMMAGPSGMDAKSVEMLIEMILQMASVDISVALSDQGVNLAFLMCGVKDSDLAKMIADTKNTSEPLLAQLPGEKYLLTAGGLQNQSKAGEKFAGEGWLGTVFKQLPMEDVDEDVLKKIEKDLVNFGKSFTRFGMTISSLPSGPHGMFGLTLVLETSGEDPLAIIRNCYKNVWTLTEDEEFQAFKKVFVHAADAETIDGNKVDTLKVDLKAAGDDIDKEELEKVQKVLGDELIIRFGAVGPKHFVLAFGGGQDRYKNICKAVKSGGATMAKDAGITATSTQLPSPRSSEFFISVDNIIGTVKSVAKAVGEDAEIPIDLPDMNAPVAFSGCTQGNASRGDMFIPMKLATAIKEAIEKHEKAQAKAFDDEEESDDAPAKKPAKDSDDDDGGGR